MLSRFRNPVDVFVVGGGPAGLATAIAARRRGLSVAIADGAIPPIDKPCGEGLMPDGLAALRDLGITIPADVCHPFSRHSFSQRGQTAEAAFSSGPAYGIRRTLFIVSLSIMPLHAAFPCSGKRRSRVFIPKACFFRWSRAARWIVGADGSNSRVRRWAGLEGHQKRDTRFGFRRHYRVAAWTDYMELHWGDNSQIYVTPIGRGEICLALVSSDPHLRLDRALAGFPELSARLAHAEVTSTERGAITVSRRLRRVYRGNTALVGDASGGVDAITGEGLCLAFRQAALLVDCLAENNLARYQSEHRRLLRRPAMMSRLMLLMARHARLRRRTLEVFESRPRSFARMLAMHVGDGSTRDYIANGISLGWQLLIA